MRKVLAFALIAILSLQTIQVAVNADTRPSPEERGASGLALMLRRLQTIGSVLHTAAHPDDESTDMLAYMSRAMGARTAYLSLNRGEGGQNGIGPELWDGLGVIRTEELLAARKLDGGEQYFTRAFDFGFTRSMDETLQKWNRDEIIGDMVRVIRTMRPLVLVNGWSGTTQDGHGQHQTAGALVPDALKAAADPTRYPEQIKEGLQPWQVLKTYARRFGGGAAGARTEFDVGQYDPVLGRSYNELASDGRSRHRSQDMGMIQMKGSTLRSFPRLSSLVEAPEKETSLFAGIDVSLTGIAKFAGAGGTALQSSLTKIKDAAAKALAEFKMEQPELIAPHLAAGLHEVRALRATLGSLDAVSRANVDSMLATKEQQFNDALARAHGVVVDALSNTEIVTPGEAVDVSANVYFRASAGNAAPAATLKAPAKWQIAPLGSEPEPQGGGGFRGRETPTFVARFRATVPDGEAPTQPYWLAKPRTKDQYEWDATMPQTLPFSPAVATARVELTLSGERVVINQPVEYRFSDKTFGEIRRELKVAPAITLTVNPQLLVIPSASVNRTREISVEITDNARRAINGSVKLNAPQGWKIELDPRPLSFTKQGEKTARTFKVTPPAGANGVFDLQAIAQEGAEESGKKYDNGYTAISYPHIETHFIYRAAKTKVEVFDAKVAANLKVGYVMGSGDDGAQALQQLGVNVHLINSAELASADLSGYDTIVLGIRVYEVNEDVMANNKRLLEYVSNGGTLIVQYNKQEFASGNYAPYPVKMRGERVTDEMAPVTVLVPDHPLFNFPNKIGADDWKNWVQERGLYFLSEWDSHYTPVLAAPDDTGKVLNGGQLVAQYGKGNYIFTGYAWFRQFPVGTPGAYRMFANLVSYSKAKK